MLREPEPMGLTTLILLVTPESFVELSSTSRVDLAHESGQSYVPALVP